MWFDMFTVSQNREATEDVQLGQYHLPTGTRIWINIYSLHHEEKFFPQALVSAAHNLAQDASHCMPAFGELDCNLLSAVTLPALACLCLLPLASAVPLLA